MPVSVVHHRFRVDEYEEMVTHGILTEDDRVELIRGEILAKMTIGDRHAAAVKRLLRLFTRIVGEQAIISVQDPIRLRDSVPEPDLALLRPKEDFYASGKPGPDDVLLVVEVADSSLAFDREVKRSLYAEAGLAEYWIVNLIDEVIEVHRDPQPSGVYESIARFGRGMRLPLLAFPDLAVEVADVL